MTDSDYLQRISYLETQIKDKDKEIEGLRNAINQMPEFAKLSGDVCFRYLNHWFTIGETLLFLEANIH